MYWKLEALLQFLVALGILAEAIFGWGGVAV